MPDDARKFLSPQEVQERWSGAVSVGTLANWRSAGAGPVYLKLGAKVRYPLDELELFEASSLINPSNDNRKDG